MVLGPVELDTPGYPRAEEADQRGLDDVLPIDEMVARGLVEPLVDATADLRQHHQTNIRVLKIDGLIVLRLALAGELVQEGVGVDAPAGALIDALLEEHRVDVWFGRCVGWEGDCLLPGFHVLARGHALTSNFMLGPSGISTVRDRQVAKGAGDESCRDTAYPRSRIGPGRWSARPSMRTATHCARRLPRRRAASSSLSSRGLPAVTAP